MRVLRFSQASCLFFFGIGLLTTTSAFGQASSSAEKTVSVVVTVTDDHGRVGSGLELKQSDFSILVDKIPQEVLSFSHRDEPLSIGILLDVSGSMRNPQGDPRKYIKLLKEGLKRFLELSNPANEYFLLAFNKQAQVLQDWTTNTSPLIARVDGLQLKGNTAFYDACHLGIVKTKQGRQPKRAMILISDGMNNESHHTFQELRHLVRESDVLIYSINVLGDDVDVGSSLGLQGQGILDELSSAYGGLAIKRVTGRIKGEQMNAIFQFIANELRHQYSLTFKPSNLSPKEKWHRIHVRVALTPNSPRELHHLVVRTRQGFYTGSSGR